MREDKNFVCATKLKKYLMLDLLNVRNKVFVL